MPTFIPTQNDVLAAFHAETASTEMTVTQIRHILEFKFASATTDYIVQQVLIELEGKEMVDCRLKWSWKLLNFGMHTLWRLTSAPRKSEDEDILDMAVETEMDNH